MMHIPPIETLAALAIVIFLAIGLHEYAHCKMADLAGDPTPSIYGRVTLNLTKHFDPLGTIMIIVTSLSGYGIGWGKPSPINPSRMRNPRWDAFAATAAGPISNFLQAAVYGILFRVLLAAPAFHGVVMDAIQNPQNPPFIVALAYQGVLINLALCFFNLIPLGPLDGHWILGTFLPEPARTRWYIWNRQAGSIVLLVIILGSQFANIPLLGSVLGPPIEFTKRLLTGT